MEEFKRDLVIGYLHKWLTPAEKQEVFKLILTDKEFVELLREEQQLCRLIKKQRSNIDENKKETMYKKTLFAIKNKEDDNKDLVTNLVVDIIINATLPSILSRLIKIKK